MDGRDITSVIMKNAKVKFYITASLEVRAKRRFIEFKKLKEKNNLQRGSKKLEKQGLFRQKS